MSPDGADPALRERMERNLHLMRLWWVLRWVWLGEALWVIYLIQERGLTIGQVLVFEAVFSATVIASELPTGIVADRHGRRLNLVLSGAFLVPAFIAFGLATTIPMLLGSYVLFGIADAFISGADNALLFDTLRSLGREREFARVSGRMSAVQTAAIASFTVVGAAMVRWTPLSVPIVLSGMLSLPGLVIAWRLSEPPNAGERHSFLGTGRRALGPVRRTRSTWTVIMLLAATGMAIQVMAVTMQPVVVAYGVPLWTLGLFVGAQMLLSAVGSWSAGPTGQRLRLARALGIMAPLSTLALLGGASGLIWLFPLFIIPAFGFNALFPHIADFLSRRAPDRERATVLSTLNLASGFGSIGISLALALVVDRAGLHVALMAAAAGRRWPRPTRRPTPAPTSMSATCARTCAAACASVSRRNWRRRRCMGSWERHPAARGSPERVPRRLLRPCTACWRAGARLASAARVALAVPWCGAGVVTVPARP